MYHIRIDYFDNKLKANQTLYSFDISDISKVEDKIKKYLNEEIFLFSGTKLSSKDIRHFRVFCSQYDIEKCKEISDSKVPHNVIWVSTRSDILGDLDLCPEITDEIFEKTEAALKSSEIKVEESDNMNMGKANSSRNVFIVHGHDNAIRSEVELLIKKLGYNPIILFKQPDGGSTIIEKLDRETKDIVFAVILYTGCDEGKSKEEDTHKPRARQNVVFEHGMMCGLLGRNRVVALVEPGVEIPGDLSGIIYKGIDKAGHWQIEIAGEMKASGLNVDLNNLLE